MSTKLKPVAPNTPRDITAVIHTVDPSHLFEKCLASVKAQTLPPAKIEIIRNVSPNGRAAQEGLDRVETTYYIPVDDDMVLDKNCFEKLHLLINQDEKLAEVTLDLMDPLLGQIQGIHIYLTSAVKPLGFHPIEETGFDRRMRRKLIAAGHHFFSSTDTGGLHHPIYLPQEAFWKFRYLGLQLKHFINGNDFNNGAPSTRQLVEPFRGLPPLIGHFDALCKLWVKKNDINALYSIAGLMDGLMLDEATSKALSYEGRESYPPFLRLDEFIKTHNRIVRPSLLERAFRFVIKMVEIGWWRTKVYSKILLDYIVKRLSKSSSKAEDKQS